MSQGYEMEKHRADVLKGHLDAALGRVESERELNATWQSRARSSEAKIAELEWVGRSKDQRIRELEVTVATLNSSACYGVEITRKVADLEVK